MEKKFRINKAIILEMIRRKESKEFTILSHEKVDFDGEKLPIQIKGKGLNTTKNKKVGIRRQMDTYIVDRIHDNATLNRYAKNSRKIRNLQLFKRTKYTINKTEKDNITDNKKHYKSVFYSKNQNP